MKSHLNHATAFASFLQCQEIIWQPDCFAFSGEKNKKKRKLNLLTCFLNYRKEKQKNCEGIIWHIRV